MTSPLALRLARALLPAWRFFDEIEPAPKLFVRFVGPGAALGAWAPTSFAPPRPGYALLLNPSGNLALAEHALLERLLDEAAEPAVRNSIDVEQLVSYELVTRLVRGRLVHESAAGDRALAFQFKLTLAEADADGVWVAEDVLTSRVHEV